MMTRMMRIVPRDIAPSQQASRRGNRRRTGPVEQSISRPPVPAQEPGRAGKDSSRLFGLQLQCGRIDAVTQPGRAGAVLEHMAEMAVAFGAEHFGADHAVADVALLVDM